jgi:hypothetical protein
LKVVTVAVIPSECVPRIQDARITWLDAWINIPSLERQRLLHFIVEAREVERYELFDGVVLAHAIHQLPHAFALSTIGKLSIATRKIASTDCFSYGVAIKEECASSYKLRSVYPLMTVFQSDEVSASRGATERAS